MPGNFIYVSPHRDDICFSIGILACVQGGLVVSLFTRSQYSIGTEADFNPATISRISSTRQAEDQAFFARAGLREIDLRWLEAPLRGYLPFRHNDLALETARFRPKLLKVLNLIGRRCPETRPWLLCPMAIGGHRDHLIVRDTVLANAGTLRRAFRLGFYEDLPYASKLRNREEGLASFQSIPASAGFHRVVFPLGKSAELKAELIALYSSQHPEPAPGIAQFSPAAEPAQTHEALWTEEDFS